MTLISAHETSFPPSRRRHSLRRYFASMKPLVSAAFLTLASGSIGAQAAEIGATFGKPCPFGDCSAGIAFTFLGETSIQTGFSEADVEFGGISGLDFDQATGRFVALSDDRAERGPARVYELDVDLSAQGLQGVSVRRHISLLDVGDIPFAPQSVDPEALRLGPEGFYWTSEGGGSSQLPPSVRVSSPDGKHLKEFALPDGFAPTAEGSSGIHDNLAFESLTMLPSGDVLVALEAALQQDGPKPGLMLGSPARMVQFDALSGKPKAQYVYMISPVPQAGVDGEKAMIGLSEMLALEDGRILTVERSFAEGAGNTIKIFMVDLSNATDVSHISLLARHEDLIVPARKTEVLDLNGIGLRPDNIEAMAIGRAGDGTEILLLAADNNFSARQKSQFFAFEIVQRLQ
jgi:hypothetical protein